MRSRLSVRSGDRVGVIPHNSVVPIVARNQDASWLYVDYLGYEGWVSGFNVRSAGDTSLIPEAPNLDPLEVIPVTIIPPEVQLAELNQLREYVSASHDWRSDYKDFGAGLPGTDHALQPACVCPSVPVYCAGCPAAPGIEAYLPRLETAIEALNGAIEP